MCYCYCGRIVGVAIVIMNGVVVIVVVVGVVVVLDIASMIVVVCRRECACLLLC